MAYRIRNAQRLVIAEVDTIEEAAGWVGINLYHRDALNALADHGVVVLGYLTVELINRAHAE